MTTTTSGTRFRVIDDFLPPELLDPLRAVAGSLTYEERPSVLDADADGHSFRSRGAVLHRDEVLADTGRLEGVEAVNRAVLTELDAQTDLLGTGGLDWTVVGLAFWRYPVGSRLGWHNDARADRRGEFILFLHDEWRPSWGGELMILDRDVAELPPAPEGIPAYAAVEHQVAQAPDTLVAVVPKPNRLVVVQEGTSHCIHRVDPTAGHHERLSMTGFVGTPTASGPARRADIPNLERLAPFLVGSTTTGSTD